LSAVTTPAQVFELPEYNLAIVKVADISGAQMAMPIPAETVRSFVNSQPELTLGPSVYEVAGTPTQEALIPIGEILVKFKPGVTEERSASCSMKTIFRCDRATTQNGSVPSGCQRRPGNA
jgi:hypothetical protein